MVHLVRSLLKTLLVRPVVRFCYGDIGFLDYRRVFTEYLFLQKVLRINGKVPWPVHPTSRIVGWERIKKGENCFPGVQLGNYIQANNGIVFGDNVRIGPNVGIISSNHDAGDFAEHTHERPLTIGSHVWIGMNVVVLPGVCIGDNSIIGAGSVVVQDIPANSLAVGNPCRVVRSILTEAPKS